MNSSPSAFVTSPFVLRRYKYDGACNNVIINNPRCLPSISRRSPIHDHHINSIRCGAQKDPSSRPALTKSPLQLVKDANTVYTQYKPKWCQVWTISTTGCIIVLTSWKLFHQGYTSILSVFATFAVVSWWYLFLILYPQQVLQDREQQPK